jgi:Asp-tRNA(Asn)/Glu-tRNA(Gln) amidotransferase A subunit family amidase
MVPEDPQVVRAGVIERARALGALIDVDATRAPGRAGAFIAKDNIDVAGFVTSGGTQAFAAHRPAASAGAVLRLVAAGHSCIGKANLHELALGITSNNAFTGPVRNPYDPSRIAGGSSGGSAVAVALGLVPFSLCTDTGGSARIPAALCGVVGYRPTLGRYPLDGLLTLSPSRDTPGLIARDVAEILRVDACLAPEDAGVAAVDLAQVRIGLPQGPWADDVEPAIAAARTRVVGALAAAGVVPVPVDLAPLVALDDRCGFAIAMYETIASWRGHVATRLGLGFEDWLGSIASPDVRELMRAFSGDAAVPRAVYEHARDADAPALRRAYAELFARERLDALLVPTTPLTAAPIGADEHVSLNGRDAPTFPTYTRTTRPDSMAGLPSISLPAGHDASGLPLGLMLVGRAGADRALLGLARVVEPLFAVA